MTTTNEQSSRELLPCPFCGGEGDFCSTGVVWVRCQACGADGQHGPNQAAAIAKWNRRSALATPDQGDERRAMTAAYLAFCADKAPDHNEVGFPYFKAAWQARAYQPVAQPVVDQEPASMSDNGSCGSQVSGKPVAQEAITWSPAGYNKELAVDATGKVRGEVCEHSIDPRWDARANDTRLGEYLNRDQAKAAVLAAIAAPQPSEIPRPVSVYTRKAAETLKALGYVWTDSNWAPPQPSQGAECTKCNGGHLVEDGDAESGGNKIPCPACFPAAPHPPVSAEAGKGEPFGYWHEGPTEDESEFFLAKDLPSNDCPRCFPLYLAPSESVAVSGEDWHEPRQLIAGARERANMVATEGSEAWLAEFTRAVLALAAPMPQPEPTSKGEAWNMEKLTNILRTYGHSGLLDAVNFEIAEASQQREPQEAAERPANFTELWELYSRVGDAHENHGRNHEKTMEARATFHAALMRALSAPQEAGKPAACTTIADCTTPKLCLSVGTCKGYYVMPASVRESAAPVEEAGKVEPVADEPVAEFLGRRRTPEGTTEFWGVMLCDPMQDPPKGSKLYLRPTQQALSDAQRRVLDFLYGVGELEGCGFSEKPVGELGNFWWRKHLRSAFPDILAAAGGSEK